MKTFTLDQANALVPELEKLLEEMAHVRNELLAIGPSIEAVLTAADGNGGSKKASEYVLLMQRLNACTSTFQEWGCELKDLDSGLVDFPHDREGQIVYLCWKRGESRIEYWHDLESGFSGRQPL
ncbi:MAG: DUF2203 domain-containing protein [Chloroflexi bacterium]|nr:DUF2203 domain-containing protein [Chloroflexota bacterium]